MTSTGALAIFSFGVKEKDTIVYRYLKTLASSGGICSPGPSDVNPITIRHGSCSTGCNYLWNCPEYDFEEGSCQDGINATNALGWNAYAPSQFGRFTHAEGCFTRRNSRHAPAPQSKHHHDVRPA